MQILVLGPLEIRSDGGSAELGDRLQRLLAALVVADGSVVSTDRLMDIIWSGEPPHGAVSTLRTYVTRLRRALDAGRDDVIRFQHPGYALDLRPGELDSELFEEEMSIASAHLRTAEPSAAVRVLEVALARWRGGAFPSFADEEWARPTVVRLEERRLEAREAYLEALLGVGAIDRAVAEASALVESQPLRDRPRGLLMRSLYQAGRQAEALRAASDFRRYLSTETGLDPSEEIVELESRIARGDPVAATRVRRGFELHERIGEGAFSVVHRATQSGLERDVAVKIIRGELADRPEFIRRFEVEARTVARVEHPNVVPLFDYWREPGAAYLVMRLLRGGSVEQALRARGPYSCDQTMRLLEEVGGALEAAHRANVVHRDVRPANLLLDQDGVTYLSDFGIALPSASSDDLPIVSPAYAAPEVLRGEPAGAAADVLSFGVTVFELLTGRLPFADSLGRAEVIRRQLGDPLPPIRATRTDLPSAVDDVLARATAKAADDRHASVAALVDDLSTALAGDGSRRTERPPASRRSVENPYVGLHAFDERDADRYFGREDLVVELVEALERLPMVAVVGASGSGKSSAVRAGLLPAVRRGAVTGSDEWFVTTMMPGPEPVDALETALLRVAVNPPVTLRSQLAQPGGLLRAIRRVLPDERAHLLLVIDQFEELFTQVGDAEARDDFLTELALALTAPDSPLHLVATLRADHYDAPLRHLAMSQLVTDGTVTVRPMTPEELERAITAPARAVNVDIEPALVVELVAAVSARPTTLPLLQFSLTELFDRRVADVMLHATHGEIGGLTGALAARADRIVDAGGPEQEAATRRIFGRLVTLGDGAEDTRRRALLSEIEQADDAAWLIDAFVKARLITVDRDPATRAPTVEVAHEALLRDWPRLRRWLDEDRADLRTLREVTTHAEGWHASGCDAAELAGGGRLVAATELAVRHGDWLNDDERAWIEASAAAARDADERQRAAIERDRRQNRRLRQLLSTAVVLLVVAGVAAVSALVLRNRAVDSERDASIARDEALESASVAAATAEQARAAEAAAEANAARAFDAEAEAEANAASAESERELAVRQQRLAEARALVASGAAVIDDDPELAVMLALNGADRLGADPQSVAVLREALAASRTVLYHAPSDSPGEDAKDFGGDFSPDGTLVVIGSSDGNVMMREVGSGEVLWTKWVGVLGFGRPGIVTPRFVNGGAEVAVGVWYWDLEGDETPGEGVQILDAATGKLLRSFGEDGCGWRLKQPESPSDTVLLAYANTRDWEAENGCVVVDAEGDRFGQLHWFDVESGEATPVGPAFSDTRGFPVLVDRAPAVDRELIVAPVAADADLAVEGFAVARVKDAATGGVLMEFPVNDSFAAALSPDGMTVVIGGTQGPSNGALELIDVATGDRSELEGHPGGNVNEIFFGDDSARFVTTDTNGGVRIWQRGSRSSPDRLVAAIRTGDATVGQAAISADGRRLALFSVDHGRVLELDRADLADVGVIDTCDGATLFNLNTGLNVAGDLLLTRALCAGDGSEQWQVVRDEIFDLTSGERRAGVRQRAGQVGALSADGRFLADQVAIPPSADSPRGMTGTVSVIDVEDGTSVLMDGLCGGNLDDGTFEARCATPPAEPYAASSSDIRFSPDGRLVAMGTRRGGPGRVWDARTGETLASWPFAHAAFSPDGSLLATVSIRDIVLEVRETERFTVIAEKELDREEELYDMRFAADGTTVIANTIRGVFFYDATDLGFAAEPIDGAHEAQIRHMEISEDRTMFATGGADGFVRVWGVATHELLHEIPVATGDRVQAVAFANNDSRLLATTAAGPVRIYTLDADELLSIARRRLVRAFTLSECSRYFGEEPCPTLEEMREV